MKPGERVFILKPGDEITIKATEPPSVKGSTEEKKVEPPSLRRLRKFVRANVQAIQRLRSGEEGIEVDHAISDTDRFWMDKQGELTDLMTGLQRDNVPPEIRLDQTRRVLMEMEKGRSTPQEAGDTAEVFVSGFLTPKETPLDTPSSML
jgi:hypothetical protein